MTEKITNQNQIARHKLAEKINELVDAVNNQQIQLNNHECRLLDLHSRITALEDPTYHEEPAENVQPDFITTTYMTDGHIQEYYGKNGASIVTDHPIPAGYTITIKEIKGE